jgi:hypothetical protein
MKFLFNPGWAFSLILLLTICSCNNDLTNRELTLSSRSFLMGFQNSAPRIDFDLTIQSLHMWEQRADAAMITTEVPWDSLFKGTNAVSYVNANYKGLVDYYRTRGFKLWVFIDPANGLNRATDATALVTRKKSISQPDMQKLYRRFAFVMDSILKPDHMGLALETNAIRGLSPDSVYQGVKKAANDAAIEIHASDNNVKLSVSVQVDYAWGKLDNTGYKSVDDDFIDFPFIEELGLSSYPYFVFNKPQDIPLNYYSALVSGKTLSVFVSEGGWTSASLDNIKSSPEKQRDYIFRQAQLLQEANATAVFQLTFTDIDLSAWPPNTPANLSLFASLGLVDINLKPKPALSAWDSIFDLDYKGK